MVREAKPVDCKGSYARAGVDTDLAARVKKQIGQYARTTFNPSVLSGIGFFGGMYEFKGYQNPVLISSVDQVGTKTKIAAALNKFDTVGIDIVSHCVNDIFTSGADPIFFLDYIGTSNLVPEKIEAIVQGLTKACKEVNCPLIGGETGEMPGLYATGNDFDLVGFVIGAVEKDKIIMGKTITDGDTVLGLPSSGLHTNGYSLARNIFGETSKALSVFYPELGRTLGDALLEPHICYYNRLKPVLPFIKGMAHITGSGLIGNIPRVLPAGLTADLQSNTWTIPPIFTLIQKQGNITKDEMYHVFNMGVGMAVICSPDNVKQLTRALPEASVIGKIINQTGDARVIIDGKGYHRDKVL
jgi:phosphoribosylformylglycinamidine cyclo-ligase